MNGKRLGLVLIGLALLAGGRAGGGEGRRWRVGAAAFVVQSGWQRVGPVLRAVGPAVARAEVVLPRAPIAVWVLGRGKLELTAGPLKKVLRQTALGRWQQAGVVPGGPTSVSIAASAAAEFCEVCFAAAGAAAPASLEEEPPRADGLLLALDFEENDPQALFDAAGRRRLSTSGPIERAAGAWGKALQVHRSGVPVESSPSFASAADALTVEAWVRPDAVDGYRAVLFKGLRSVDFQAVHFHFGTVDGKPELKFMDASGVWSGLYRSGGKYPLPAVPVGQWGHIAATFDKGYIRLFVDGRQAASRDDRMNRLLPNGFALSVGEGQNPGGGPGHVFAGLVDDVRLLARALTPAEIAASYEAGRARHVGAAPAAKPKAEPVPTLAQKLKIVERYEKNLPADVIGRARTTAAVKPHQGLPALWINDRPVAPVAMIPIEHFPRDVCRDFAAAGVHVYSHIIWNWARIVPEAKAQKLDQCTDWWLGPGRYAFERIDRQVQAIIAADPQAYIFLRLKLNPPAWWVSQNPDELAQHADGRRGPQYSMASEVWEQTYERMLRDLIGHIEGSPYAGHIIGYQPAGGEASEWYWWDHDRGLIDYSPAARQRFRKWLRARYPEQDALRRAWNDRQVTFDTAQPPSEQARAASEHGLFRDVRTARPVMDFQRFLTDMTVHNIIRSCRICKEASGRRKITGVFYGYSFHYAATRHGPWNLGFLGLGAVLDSPEVDFICSPTDYGRRRGGEPGNFVSVYTASCQLHGKLYWDEVDTRTHHYRGPSSCEVRSLAETLAVHQRALGYGLTKGTALWWFTLCGDHTFHDDAVMEDIARLQQAAVTNLGVPKTHRRDVAVLADEQTFLYLRMGVRGLMQPLTQALHDKLALMGAPFDMYLLSDVADPRMPDYKLYIFLNPFYVTEQLRAAIRQKVRRQGAVSAWFYAPGYVREDGRLDVDGIRDLTGIAVRESPEPRPLRLAITHFDHPLTAEIDRADVLPPTEEIGPVFTVDDPRAEILGRLAPEGSPGLAVRDFGDWKAAYFSAPTVTTGLLRGLVRWAGGHVWSTSDDTFYANQNFAMIHTATGGLKQIKLPERRDAFDAISGECLGRGVTSIELKIPERSTRIFRFRAP